MTVRRSIGAQMHPGIPQQHRNAALLICKSIPSLDLTALNISDLAAPRKTLQLHFVMRRLIAMGMNDLHRLFQRKKIKLHTHHPFVTNGIIIVS